MARHDADASPTRPPVVLVALTVDGTSRHDGLADLARATGCSLAYLQVGTPSLVEELDRLAASGADEVRLVQAPGERGKPGRSWLRRVAGHWVREHGGAVRVTVADREVTGSEAPLSSPAWEDVPGHRHHVLVCRGPRCAARGAADTAVAIDEALQARGLGSEDVLVAQTGCLYPCNQAPVVVIHPEDAWYGPVDASQASSLVAGLVGEAIDPPRRLPRERI